MKEVWTKNFTLYDRATLNKKPLKMARHYSHCTSSACTPKFQHRTFIQFPVNYTRQQFAVHPLRKLRVRKLQTALRIWPVVFVLLSKSQCNF